MLAYRCYPKDPNASPGEPGHWSYLPRPQTTGRWDNATRYDSWYLADTDVGAIAESFYSKTPWRPETFLTRLGYPRVVAAFEVDVSLGLINLDDPETLIRFSMVPSQVVRQNLPVTQRAALKIFEETRTDPRPASGVKWWSSQVPAEDVFMLWSEPGGLPSMRYLGDLRLGIDVSQVQETARLLRRQIVK